MNARSATRGVAGGRRIFSTQRRGRIKMAGNVPCRVAAWHFALRGLARLALAGGLSVILSAQRNRVALPALSLPLTSAASPSRLRMVAPVTISHRVCCVAAALGIGWLAFGRGRREADIALWCSADIALRRKERPGGGSGCIWRR